MRLCATHYGLLGFRDVLTDQLRKEIADSGLTHYAIGKLAGVSPDQIDRFMSGERDLRLETASRIAEALKLHLVKRRSAK